jgi:DNA-binding XRE family transcriptional regulator
MGRAVPRQNRQLFVMSFDSEAAHIEAYCRRVKDLRAGKGWTQKQMAAALGIPLDRYKKYEDRSPMPTYLLERFALIVDRTVGYVVTGNPEPRHNPPPIGGKPSPKRSRSAPDDP